MTLLATAQQPSPSTSADTPSQSQQQQQQQSPPSIQPWMSGISQAQSPTIYNEPHRQSHRGSEQSIDIVVDFSVTLLEADQILHEYTSSMLPNFPFVPITSHRAQDMYREQPLLLKAIISSCRPQMGSVRTSVDQWFREYFAYHVAVLNECRLELLQAMLVYVAW